MANAKEYRGQPIAAQLSARLEPPSDDYADCECMLVLTLWYDIRAGKFIKAYHRLMAQKRIRTEAYKER